MSDSWTQLLAETSKSFHDLAQSPRVKGEMEIVGGVTAIALVIMFPEGILAALIGGEELAEIGLAARTIKGLSTASKLVSGTALVTVGSVQLASGEDLSEAKELATNPLGLTDRIETVEQVHEAFCGKGLEQMKAISDLFGKFAEDFRLANEGDASRSNGGAGGDTPGDRRERGNPINQRDPEDGGN